MNKTKEVLEGETASLTCKATGKPLPEYKWIAKHTVLINLLISIYKYIN